MLSYIYPYPQYCEISGCLQGTKLQGQGRDIPFCPSSPDCACTHSPAWRNWIFHIDDSPVLPESFSFSYRSSVLHLHSEGAARPPSAFFSEDRSFPRSPSARICRKMEFLPPRSGCRRRYAAAPGLRSLPELSPSSVTSGRVWRRSDRY